MEPSTEPPGSRVCCLLSKALTLDPVPVVGDAIYVPGAEGLCLHELTNVENEILFKPCPAHRFNFKHTVKMLLSRASGDTPCQCEHSVPTGSSSSSSSSSCSSAPNPVHYYEGRGGRMSGLRRVAPYVPNDKPTTTPATPRRRGRDGDSSCHRGTLWAYEMDNVVTAYRWLMHNRNLKYSKCSDAVIVYQLKKSRSLPPGLYVYKNRPSHFGCTAVRPLTVVDQFNFVVSDGEAIDLPENNEDRDQAKDQQVGKEERVDEDKEDEEEGRRGRVRGRELLRGPALPSALVIELFPGRDNFSALYVIGRKLPITVPEYGNRIFGEAMALGIIDPCSLTNARSCEHHEVAMRTERACVIDLRWKGFATKTACLQSIPKMRGMQAVIWSNHKGDVQEIECKVLTWLLGLSNQLPKEVQMIDYKRETLGIRYILMDVKRFQGILPESPCGGSESLFIHTYFSGDLALAECAIGQVPGHRSRMGSPCSSFDVWYRLSSLGCHQPTPFSSGVRHGYASDLEDDLKSSLLEWTLQQDGTSCLAIAVQHTLYYHVEAMEYKMMISHTVMDNDTTLNIFKL